MLMVICNIKRLMLYSLTAHKSNLFFCRIDCPHWSDEIRSDCKGSLINIWFTGVVMSSTQCQKDNKIKSKCQHGKVQQNVNLLAAFNHIMCLQLHFKILQLKR